MGSPADSSQGQDGEGAAGSPAGAHLGPHGLNRGVIRLELTKSGKRREVPLNADSYTALVSLSPKESGRVFGKQTLGKAQAAG